MTGAYRVEQLARGHDRRAFSCGDAFLDRYFHAQVTQDVRRRVTNCFVAVENGTDVLAGYYTIASASIAAADLPSDETRRLPRYPAIPAVLIGRLAVDLRFRGRGIGGMLLADAAERVLHAAPAAYALLVDSKNEQAAVFYEHFGFSRVLSRPATLYLSLETAKKLWHS